MSFVKTVRSNPQVAIDLAAFQAKFTKFVAYTPTFEGLGVVTNINFKWRRQDHMLFVHGFATSGTSTAVPLTVTLPANLTIDTNYLVGSNCSPLGFMWSASTTGQDFPSTGRGPFVIMWVTPDTNKVTATLRANSTSVNAWTPTNGSTFTVSGFNLVFRFEVPIVEWG